MIGISLIVLLSLFQLTDLVINDQKGMQEASYIRLKYLIAVYGMLLMMLGCPLLHRQLQDDSLDSVPILPQRHNNSLNMRNRGESSPDPFKVKSPGITQTKQLQQISWKELHKPLLLDLYVFNNRFSGPRNFLANSVHIDKILLKAVNEIIASTNHSHRL